MSHQSPARLTNRAGHRRPSGRRILAAAAGVALAAALLTAGGSPAVATDKTAAINAQVLAELAAEGTAEFFVTFDRRPDLSAAGAASTGDRSAAAAHVYDALTAAAAASQAGVAALLDGKGVAYTSYWISNAILVTGDRALAAELAGQPGVTGITPNRTVPLVEPVAIEPAGAAIQAVEWGIENINADQVWDEFGVRGEGIVVANIDTGVQFDHPAVVDQYRGNLGGGQFDHNHNWFDPAGICSPGVPCDNHGHGTHTMGTMVGDDGGSNQVGVAPAAQWIAAKGCEVNTCSESSLLASGQWMVAPTDVNNQNPDPSKAPHIVNNSWGGGGGDTWYAHIVDAWINADIFPMFSNGNNGPGCRTSGSPGDYPQSYSAGAYDISNQIANFSSRGSSLVDNGIKPNLSAPGVQVRSSVPTNGYANASGTSMASPHVAGTVALMWSADGEFAGDIGGTRTILDETARDVSDLQCGGTAGNNNVWGEGRLDAHAAVAAVLGSDPEPPDDGEVAGTVTAAASGDPLAGARVVLSHGPGGRYDTTTGPSGTYTIPDVVPGSYRVTVSAQRCTRDRDELAVVAGEVTDHTVALAGNRCGS